MALEKVHPEPQGNAEKEQNNTKKEGIGDSEDGLVDVWAHGRKCSVVPRSLFLFRASSWVRKVSIWIVMWKWFDRFILFLILLNSLVLCLTDYAYLKDGQITSEGSLRNTLVKESENYFTFFFVIEFLLKAIASGLLFGRKTYFKDGWNHIDFVVVLGSVLQIIPSIPNVSVLRTVRVLRPLRSLTAVPSMRKLVSSLLKSIPALLNVVALMMFVFGMWGILGVQMWSGAQHAMCRLSSSPLLIFSDVCEDPSQPECWETLWSSSAMEGKNLLLRAERTGESNNGREFGIVELVAEGHFHYSVDDIERMDDSEWKYFAISARLNRTLLAAGSIVPCIDAVNDDFSLSHSESPWNTARRCFWPAYRSDVNLCGLKSGFSVYRCEGSGTFCGSNYDHQGNRRFATSALMEGLDSVFKPELSYGYTMFDNVFRSFLTIFQVITMEGWVDVMYQIQDSYDSVLGFIYFYCLVMFGAFFLVNLTLAVIWDNFSTVQENQKDVAQSKNRTRRRSSLSRVLHPISGELQELARRVNPDLLLEDNTSSRPEAFDLSETPSPPPADDGPTLEKYAIEKNQDHEERITLSSGTRNPIRRFCRVRTPQVVGVDDFQAIVDHVLFAPFIVLIIFGNTVVLAMDRHPIDSDVETVLEFCNFVFTLIFAVEMVVKLLGMGWRGYAEDSFNLFDGFIVLAGMVEVIFEGPQFLDVRDQSGTLSGGSGAISALRTFRLFRIFKLAKSWRSLNILLKTIGKTVKDVANFGVLLLIFMFIFSLVGMQFFSHTFCFDPVTHLRISEVDSVCHGEHPRAHFDDLLWAFLSVFQILTGENWNLIMYDSWRAVGWRATLYYFTVVVIGNFIILNLFLAILLGNFEGMEELVSGGNSEKKKTRVLPSREELTQNDAEARRTFAKKVYDSFRQISRTMSGHAPLEKGFTVAVSNVSDIRNSRGPSCSREMGCGSSDDDDFEPFQVARERKNKMMRQSSLRQSHRPMPNLSVEYDEEDLIAVGKEEGEVVEVEGEEAKPTMSVTTETETEFSSSSDEDGAHSTKDIAHTAAALFLVDVRRKKDPKRPHSAREESSRTLLADAALPPKISLARKTTVEKGTSPKVAVRRCQSDRLGTGGKNAPAHRVVLPPLKPQVRSSSADVSKDGVMELDDDLMNDPGMMRVSSGGSSSSSSAESSPRPLSRAVQPQLPAVDSFVMSSQRLPMHKRKKIRAPTYELSNRSLLLFGVENRFRVFCADIVHHWAFDPSILFLIIVSSILLVIDNPLNDPNLWYVKMMKYSDLILTVVFVLEMALKVIALGFFAHRKSYLRNGFNILDCAIVCVSLVSYLDVGMDLKSLRSLRTFRALRPLRMISRWGGLRLVVGALISSIPSIVNVLVVCFLFFIIFGIVGVSYFKGTYYQCSGAAFDLLTEQQLKLLTYPVPWSGLSAVQQGWFGNASATIYAASDVINSQSICSFFGADWAPAIPQSFDNLLAALGTLFEMATTEMWMDIMLQGVDSRGIGMQPVRDANEYWSFFFVFFMIIGNFFIMNLFVGVVIDNFNTMKERMGSSFLLTDAQKEWVKTQRIMATLKPKRKPLPPSNMFRKLCFRFSVNQTFDSFIMGTIIANVLIMAMEYFGQSDAYQLVLEGFNFGFAALFTVEAIVRICALGGAYFKDGWYRFDFAIVLGTVIGLLVKWITKVDFGSVAMIIRTFRVGRILRLVKGAKSLRRLFHTLLLTLPSLANIAALLFLLFFIYAAMGVQLFATVRFDAALDEHANFQSFLRGMTTLARCSTGESWNSIMHALANRDVSVCDPNLDSLTWEERKNICGFSQEHDCTPLMGCGTATAYPFFYSFTLIVSVVILNLLIAVILENFSEAAARDKEQLSEHQLNLVRLVCRRSHVLQFVDAWSDFDHNATQYISSKDLVPLLQRLEPPLGFKDQVITKVNVLRVVSEMNLRIYEGNLVHFWDVQQGLALRIFSRAGLKKKDLEVPEARRVRHEWRRKFANHELRKTAGYDISSHFAALSIQSAYHSYLLRKRLALKVKDRRRQDRREARRRSRAKADV